MGYKEAIRKIISDTSQSKEPVPLTPTSKLQSVIGKSKILDLFNQLSNISIETEKEIIEDGKKMIIVAEWETKDSSHLQIIISVTESSISFIGNNNDNQYIRLEGENMRNSRKIKKSLKDTFSNPQIL